MGTRGTITFIFNGKKIKVYNHWDSYPEGLGRKIVKELKVLLESRLIEEIIERLNEIKIFNYGSVPTEEEIEKLQKYSDVSVSNQDLNDVYCLLRKTQGSIQKILEAGYVVNHEGDEDYNYFVNFDSKKFGWDGMEGWRFNDLDSFLKECAA
jgi:hypothetical protein